MERIDFVIPWVDGSDPAWQSGVIKFKQQQGDSDARIIRYRDWESLKYWFRGVETFAPWVGKIHFITWGHLPKWLNTAHPKLNIVNHKDYIPADYLPTYSSNPIELNIHRIEGLSEQFVLFNDDTFLIRKTPRTRFFKGGLPRDIACLSISPSSNIDLVNKRHTKKEVIGSYPFKWFNCRYTLSDIFKTLTLLPWQSFYGLKITHIPHSFLKSVFEQMWREEFDVLDQTSRRKVRTNSDVNQYSMRFEQIASGRFSPHGDYDAISCYATSDKIDDICSYITEQKGSMICINDNENITDFESTRDRLNAAFDVILPNKSSYEL